MKRTPSCLTLAAACLSLGAAAHAGFSISNGNGPASVHPEALPGGSFAAPSTPGIPSLPGQPGLATPSVPGVETPAAPATPAPSAIGSLERAAMPFSENGGFRPGSSPSAPSHPSVGQQQAAAAQTFDGAGPLSRFASPDDQYSWYDQTTGQTETQVSKIQKVKALIDDAVANDHPLIAGVKNAVANKPKHRVDNSTWDAGYVLRTQGDDAFEHPNQEPLLAWTAKALQEYSPEFLAAKWVGMLARHAVRAAVPNSAEKTYLEGSAFVRAFMYFTGSSSASSWNWTKDVPAFDSVGQRTAVAFAHFVQWMEGFRYPDVRMGPYFQNKIKRAEGDPVIDADPAGRTTLNDRAHRGQIAQDKADAGVEAFKGFVSNER